MYAFDRIILLLKLNERIPSTTAPYQIIVPDPTHLYLSQNYNNKSSLAPSLPRVLAIVDAGEIIQTTLNLVMLCWFASLPNTVAT